MRTKMLFGLVLIALVFTGCFSDPVQDDLINYINSELAPLADLEAEAIEKYESVVGINYTSDIIVYNTLIREVVPTYRKFVDRLEKIRPRTKEVQEVHELYIEAANIQYNAFVQILAAIEQSDIGLVTIANENLFESRRLLRTYENKLMALGDKHNVVIE